MPQSTIYSCPAAGQSTTRLIRAMPGVKNIINGRQKKTWIKPRPDSRCASRATCGRLWTLNVPHASRVAELPAPFQLTVESSQVRHGRHWAQRGLLLDLLVVSPLAPVAFGQFGKVAAPAARASSVSSTVFYAFAKAQFISTFVFLAHTHKHTQKHTLRHLMFLSNFRSWFFFFFATATVNYLINKVCTGTEWSEFSLLRKYMIKMRCSIINSIQKLQPIRLARQVAVYSYHYLSSQND